MSQHKIVNNKIENLKLTQFKINESQFGKLSLKLVDYLEVSTLNRNKNDGLWLVESIYDVLRDNLLLYTSNTAQTLLYVRDKSYKPDIL